ncbi:hypothetical protein PPERSA_07964 [Pseudocohnilembus persalinus]|uniref:RING-type domain-containing protein n=1 Tax=Pseudocohnilembus persalinus TaxID=266149 RepID=A0A0V0QBL8_PSEPJ|nr:hypothetical protein PPERSA_07964 [Pseudocohnilembus persalinus]|eukprot:KRW99479.1 hypothetical protein PPERSA_07964 [Pseudocohnilembus persalinus]
MPKHGKNNYVRSDFTYQERRMLKHYGTQTVRLGSNSQIKFGQCLIYLHNLQNPVACLKGHVYCKACVIENLMEQKKKNEQLMEKYNLQQKQLEEKPQLTQDDDIKKIQDFEKLETQFDPKLRKNIYSDSTVLNTKELQKSKQEIFNEYIKKNQSQTKEEQISNSFWLPENHSISEAKIQKPENKLKCPASMDHELKIKKLIPLQIQEVQGERKETDYQCYVCSKQLQFQKIAASKNCGHVQCLSCLQVSVKDSNRCGVCMKKCEKDDIVEIQSSQSAFAQHNKVEANSYVQTCTI